MVINKWRNICSSTCIDAIIKKLMMIFILLLVSSASFSGYFIQNAFLDNYEPQWNYRRSFTRVMDESANRPFIYRQLVPIMTKEISNMLPTTIHKGIEAKWHQDNSPIAKEYAKTSVPDEYIVEYHVMYVLCFAFWTLAIFIIKKLGELITGDNLAGILGASIFAGIFPILEINGGEYYDLTEVFFFALSIYLAVKGYWLALIIVSPIATINKESFFFFLITLYPFIRKSCLLKRTLMILGSCILLSGLTYLYIHNLYSGNAGGTVELHLGQHLSQLFWWKTYTRTTLAYGMKFGGGMFFLHIIFVVWIAKFTWKKLSREWKKHILLALCLTVPLYMCFCAVGETRNLSILYMGFCVMLTYFIHELICKYYQNQEKRIAKNE